MKQRTTLGMPTHCRADYRFAFGIDIATPSFAEFSQPITNRLADRSGPSWLTSSLGHAKDSLHSIGLIPGSVESVALRTYQVLVVMDQYTRRIIGPGVHRGIVDGLGLCRVFNRAIR